ncbi:MAG: amidohydrolase family protein [Thermodesulfobacteriota bacterium]|nr:amidohydrolase family protein [Thermodesulfobacteriota bacterium]
MEKKKITPEELREYRAIDTMCRPFYPDRDVLKKMFTNYEFQIMAITTFGGVLKHAGIENPEEAWKAMAMMGMKESLEEVVEEMDTIGVDYVCIDQMGVWSQHDMQLDIYATLEKIAEWNEKSNGKIIGGCTYNPHKIEWSLKYVEKAVKEFGFKYLWIHPGSYGLPLDDKRFYPLYALCLDLDIPVTMQTGQSAEPLPSDFSRPMRADEIAIHFPSLKIVLTHTGFPWIQEWISMLWRHPNVYGNIGAYMPSSLDPALITFIDRAGRDKALWATNGLGLTRCKQEFLELPIRDATKKAVLGENARRVFKLD